MTRVEVQLPEDLKRRAETRAREKGVSLDDVVVDALKHELAPIESERMMFGKPVVRTESMPCPFPHPEPDL